MKNKKPKIKPLIAYAVINKRNLKLDILDIFADKDVQYAKDKEMLVKVEIRVAEKQ